MSENTWFTIRTKQMFVDAKSDSPTPWSLLWRPVGSSGRLEFQTSDLENDDQYQKVLISFSKPEPMTT